MKKCAFVFILLLIPILGFCQSDYLVTIKSDTLKGDLRILSYDVQDRVQISAEGKKQMITSLQILFVQKNGEIFKPVKHDNNIRLMKLIKGGYLSLYGYKLPNQATYDGRLLVKQNGSTLELPNITFKKMMSTYLEDCSSLSDQLKAGDLSRKDIEKIVDLYNECVGKGKKAAAAAPEPETADTLLKRQRTVEVENLASLVREATFNQRQDALDLLKDIQSKIDRNENIPNYQIETLRALLSGKNDFKSQLEKVIALLKNEG
jgi:hypothetical protein